VLDWLLRLHASQITAVRTFALWWHSKGKHISHFIAETSIAETATPNCPIPAEGDHTHLYKQERKRTPDTGAEAVKPDPGFSWEGRVGDENAESCGVVRPLRYVPLFFWRWSRCFFPLSSTKKHLLHGQKQGYIAEWVDNPTSSYLPLSCIQNKNLLFSGTLQLIAHEYPHLFGHLWPHSNVFSQAFAHFTFPGFT